MNYCHFPKSPFFSRLFSSPGLSLPLLPHALGHFARGTLCFSYGSCTSVVSASTPSEVWKALHSLVSSYTSIPPSQLPSISQWRNSSDSLLEIFPNRVQAASAYWNHWLWQWDKNLLPTTSSPTLEIILEQWQLCMAHLHTILITHSSPTIPYLLRIHSSPDSLSPLSIIEKVPEAIWREWELWCESYLSSSPPPVSILSLEGSLDSKGNCPILHVLAGFVALCQSNSTRHLVTLGQWIMMQYNPDQSVSTPFSSQMKMKMENLLSGMVGLGSGRGTLFPLSNLISSKESGPLWTDKWCARQIRNYLRWVQWMQLETSASSLLSHDTSYPTSEVVTPPPNLDVAIQALATLLTSQEMRGKENKEEVGLWTSKLMEAIETRREVLRQLDASPPLSSAGKSEVVNSRQEEEPTEEDSMESGVYTMKRNAIDDPWPVEIHYQKRRFYVSIKEWEEVYGSEFPVFPSDDDPKIVFLWKINRLSCWTDGIKIRDILQTHLELQLEFYSS